MGQKAKHKVDAEGFKICSRCGERKHRNEYGPRFDRKVPRPSAKCKACAVHCQEDSRMRNTYGITIAERDEALVAQNGCCAICRRSLKDKKACVDHNHATGKFRAVLCVNCNLGLGSFGDDSGRLRAAAEYLELF